MIFKINILINIYILINISIYINKIIFFINYINNEICFLSKIIINIYIYL